VENNAKVGRQLIEAGAEIVFMCADYCFNDGPFLPPRMFREFVTPYLTKIVASIHEAGGYCLLKLACSLNNGAQMYTSGRWMNYIGIMLQRNG
jgi:uroporphyrinogen-III decarboxylase